MATNVRPLIGALALVISVQLLSSFCLCGTDRADHAARPDVVSAPASPKAKEEPLQHQQLDTCPLSVQQERPQNLLAQQVGDDLLAASNCQAIKQTNESNTCQKSEECHLIGVGSLLLPADGLLAARGRRRSADWRFDYIHEQTDGFRLLVREESFDERLANIMHTVATNRIADQDVHYFNSGNPDEDLANMIGTAGPQVDQEKCSRHLTKMVQLMDDLSLRLELKRNKSIGSLNLAEEHHRLVKVLDSFGRYASGHLLGRTHVFGSYSQCTRSELMLSSDDVKTAQFELVKSRYCWARWNIEKHLNSELKLIELNEFTGQKQSIFSAICIPESCHTASFEKNRKHFETLAQSQFKLPTSYYLDENLHLESIFCPADPGSAYKIPLSGQILLTLLAGWVALCLWSTYQLNCTKTSTNDQSKDETESQQQQQQQLTHWSVDKYRPTLECFDLRGSLDEFICQVQDTRPSSARVNLDAMNPIKVLGCCFVVLGHSVVIQNGIHMDIVKSLKQSETDPLMFGSIFGTLVVDSFIVITGLLLSYITMLKINQSQQRKQNPAAHAETRVTRHIFFKQWFLVTMTRFLRLLPLLYVIFWFHKGITIYLFGGRTQFWDEGHNRFTNSGACKRESWLSPLLFGPAFLPLNRQCLPQAWSVSVDLFFSLTTAPILLIMTKKPRLAFVLGAIVTLVSTSAAYYNYSRLDEDQYPLLRELKKLNVAGFVLMFGQLSYFYTVPYYRFCSILGGMMAGYYLYQYERNDQIKHWPQWLRGWATRFAVGVPVVSFLLALSIARIKPLIEPQILSLIVNHLFSSYRVVWAACNAIIFLRLVTDWNDNYFARLASGKFWRIMVKLNFAILLIHMDYLQIDLFLRTPDEYSRFSIYVSFAANYLACLVIGSLLHLLIENPMNKLINLHVMPRLKKLCN